jgi:hypothetical protein
MQCTVVRERSCLGQLLSRFWQVFALGTCARKRNTQESTGIVREKNQTAILNSHETHGMIIEAELQLVLNICQSLAGPGCDMRQLRCV